VVVINESMARQWWPDSSPLGKRLTLGWGSGDDTRWYEIIGIVGDVRHYGLGSNIRPGFYFPYTVYDYHSMWLVARTESDPEALISAVREAIWSIDSQLPVTSLRPMSDIVTESTWGELIFTRMLSAFAAIALLLALLGIYGVMSYATMERTREIGIRIAVGAHPARVIVMIVRQGMKLVGVGMLIGMLGSIGVGAGLATIFFGVSAFEPVPLVGMALLLSLVAVIASYIPALRVSRHDPVSALRYE
jgi:predicted lysophospholipase L1 biosynthesis ABC-type transport system permease subunit